MGSPPDRRFTDQEVAFVLQTAAELQEREAVSAPGGGLTLAQLEQVGVEAGIDAASVRSAVARLDERHGTPAALGQSAASDGAVAERVIAGELDAAQHESLLDAVRRATGTLGETHTVGRLFGWRGRIDGQKAEVSVSPVEGRTVVRVRIELEELTVGHYMMKAMGGGVGGSLIAGAAAIKLLGPIGVIAGAAVLGAGWLWARRDTRRDAAACQARAEAVAEALVARLPDGTGARR